MGHINIIQEEAWRAASQALRSLPVPLESPANELYFRAVRSLVAEAIERYRLRMERECQRLARQSPGEHHD